MNILIAILSVDKKLSSYSLLKGKHESDKADYNHFTPTMTSSKMLRISAIQGFRN